jgi:hypothetical protein
MDDEQRRSRLRSFALGGLLGASAVLAAARRKRSGAKQAVRAAGRGALEDAPSYLETVERERSPRD